MIPGIGSCTSSSLEDGAQGSMLAKGSSLEDCAQGSMLARAPHWRTVHKGRCLQGIRQGLLSTENDACQSSSLVSSRLHHAALQFLGMLAPLHTLYTVNMYRYGQTTTLMFNSRHCIVQCSVYTVHMYTCTLMGHLVDPYLQHCMVYTVHMYPSGLLVHSCLQQALHCTVYNVHCTHVHIWAPAPALVVSRATPSCSPSPAKSHILAASGVIRPAVNCRAAQLSTSVG